MYSFILCVEILLSNNRPNPNEIGKCNIVVCYQRHVNGEGCVVAEIILEN